MKKVILGASAILLSAFMVQQDQKNEYLIIAWNDLGMHCANKDFQNMAILPPYNNLKAQVIRRGSETAWPEVVTDNVSITYEIPGNTYSVGKTNFWDYEDALFGISLPDNIGLTGNGLSGNMVASGNSFVAEGIPITPFTDDNLQTEDPYQLALLHLLDPQQAEIASTRPVVPVSNEINCVSSGCHSSESNILNQHEDEGGFDPNDTPILCASCHPDNALGEPGMPGIDPFSYVIHEKHSEETNDCYKCHPGPNTQCHRDVMKSAGLTCQSCHGNVEHVASSIANGREPWLEEPRCGDAACHGSAYSEETGKLFRQSRGHGGLFCSACHGSPHVILPSIVDRDNVQNIALQGFGGTLESCKVCHGVDPQAPGPHGLYPTAMEEISDAQDRGTCFIRNYPIPATTLLTSEFSIGTSCRAQISIIDMNGSTKIQSQSESLSKGIYRVRLSLDHFAPGNYLIILNAGNVKLSQKIMVM
ncbi:MAG TPA: T9SS type A sorting domain-containing protein [Bacteroidales bacterium]|nr:T9SS type A sorting domain-containing protein [Bacteroidales bacterium]